MFQKNSITAFDIPGESFLIQMKSGHKIVVDGGMYGDAAEKIHNKLAFWEKEIDLLYITHGDQDHAEGAKKILTDFSVQNLVISGAHSKNPLFLDIVALAMKKNTNIVFANSKTDFLVDGIIFDTVFPQNVVGNTAKTNSLSLVFRIIFDKTSLLFTGDIEKKTETKILSSAAKIKSDILKIPHHGSKSSSSEDFLAAIRPKIALIVANKNNPFGHPNPEIITRIQHFTKKIFITKKQGEIFLEF